MTELKSLRQRVWGPGDKIDPAQIGEALRDLHGFCSSLTLTEIIPVLNTVWSEPFSLALDRRPQLLLLGEARIAGTSSAIELCALDSQIEQSGGKLRARINRARTLYPGTSYDLKFLAVY